MQIGYSMLSSHLIQFSLSYELRINIAHLSFIKTAGKSDEMT